jgi:hypothetical protein
VLAQTNDDVNQLNVALRDVRKRRDELGAEQEIDTAHGRFAFAVGDRIQFTGTDRKQGISNGRAGTIEALDGTHLAVTLDGRKAKTINFDAANFDKFRHGYAGTVYKAQGKTLDQTYLYHSEHWRSASSYVALTRHREQTALFVARNTAKDVRELARQMSRTDERRAASMFHPAQQIDTPELTAAEILARFSADMAPRKDQTMQTPQDQPQNPRFEAEPEPVAAALPVSGNLAELPQPDEPDNWSPSRAFIDTANTNQPERIALVAEAPQPSPAPEPAAQAWQQPAFSFETIKADAWTAVYLSAPENASPALLNEAYNATARCIEFLDQGIRDYPDAVTAWPADPAGQGDPESIAAKAEMRRDELHAMLFPIGAPAAEAATRERVAGLEAAAVAAGNEILQPAPEPQRPEPERPTTQQTAAEAPTAPETVSAPTAQPEAISPTGGAQSAAQAENSAEALPPNYERRDAVSPLRGLRHFLEDMGDRVIASVFHFLQDIVSPPPPPSAAEVQHRLQNSAATGNLEAQDAEAAAAAAQENAAAHNWIRHEASRAQNQHNLSFADRYGLPPTSEATRELGPAAERDLEPD